HPPGELAVARAADRAGLPYSLSTMGTRSVEEVAAVSDGSKWFQVYVWRDKGLLKDMILRAKEAGFDVLCITVDAAMLGRRERDVRRGFTLPPKMGIDTLLEGIIRPSWSMRFAFSEPISFANVAGNTDIDGSTAVDLAAFMNEQFDPTLSWEDVAWMRSLWDGPVLVKGIQSVADAVIARDEGLEGIVLSNHGGRQLDGAPGIIDLVQPVADAVGGDLDIVCDGGIRRGGDIVKALALGATSCMVGRAYLYGLAAAGEEGVDWVIEHLRTGMQRDMALCGAASVSELTPDLIYRVDTGR
ncbi:MAG: alpha-hydroxy-acid oxidizing protein, partial [Acidimicrobiaceae bacterium]|nr:alpha-hydroxy-acid oxidizing protein [Acidimicrobiaceae bacterium]